MLDVSPPPAVYEEAPEWVRTKSGLLLPQKAVLPGMTPYPGLIAGLPDNTPTFLNSGFGVSTGGPSTTFAFNPDDKADTIIVCFVVNDNNTSASTASSVTFAGNFLTLVGTRSRGLNGNNVAEVSIWMGAIPKNSPSASVVVTASRSVNRSINGVALACKNCSVAHANGQDNTLAAGLLSPLLTTTKKSLIVACASGAAGSATGWTCAELGTELFDGIAGTNWAFAAYVGAEGAAVTAKAYNLQSSPAVSWAGGAAAAFTAT